MSQSQRLTHLDTLLCGHLPLALFIRLVPYEDLPDLLGSVLQGFVM